MSANAPRLIPAAALPAILTCSLSELAAMIAAPFECQDTDLGENALNDIANTAACQAAALHSLQTQVEETRETEAAFFDAGKRLATIAAIAHLLGCKSDDARRTWEQFGPTVGDPGECLLKNALLEAAYDLGKLWSTEPAAAPKVA